MTGLTYADYLQTDTLLSLQETRTPSTARHEVVLAEHFFIVAHQSCELWLKQVVADLEAAACLLLGMSDLTDIELSLEYLQRINELLRVLHEQVIVLERLPVQYFAEFRPYLGTASGAQSRQFRQLASLMGSDQRAGRLYTGLVAAAERQGSSVDEISRRGVNAGPLYRVAEALLDAGNGYWRWKVAHLGLMAKMMGDQPGTGGTSGADYLIRRITLPFPELRLLRGHLHEQLEHSGR